MERALILTSFNVNGVNGRLPRLLEWLAETSPDIVCLVETRTKGLVVSSVYLPNGNPVLSPNFDYEVKWFDRFIEHAQELSSSRGPAVLDGDLNVVPTDYDIYNPGWWRFDAVMQLQSRAAYRRLLGRGWTDAVRSLHMYSYWVNEGALNRGHGFQLDFLLLNAAASPRLRGAGVDAAHRARERPSDHAPVIALAA